MNTPPGLVGVALLFWGLEAGLLPLAVLAALVLEGARLVSWRWNFSSRELSRLADLCRLMVLGAGAYLFSTRPMVTALWTLIQWYPLVVLPLVVSQAYGEGDRIDLGTFLLVARRPASSKADASPSGVVNPAYPYLILVVLAASAVNNRSPTFYLAVLGLGGWALFGVRARRLSPVVWAALLAVVAGLGYAGHVALHGLQHVLVGSVSEWYFAGWFDTDPYRTRTAIGHIGNLKRSERVVLRVTPGEGVRIPLLLREASYSIYAAAEWFATDVPFAPVAPEADLTTWTLRPGPVPPAVVGVSAYLSRGRGVLALPNGAVRLESLRVGRAQRNDLGVVKVDEGLGLVGYRVRFDGQAPREGAPLPLDLRLPAKEAPLVSQLAGDLGLAGLLPRERIERIAAFFRDRFRYSTYLGVSGFGAAGLEDFLLRSRAGHCEYFATATVLLLRAAGIPARYAVGYSVQEFSGLEQQFVARERHAHSWALAYVDGTWQDVDTTPPAWFGIEAAGAPWWAPLHDLATRAWFLFSRWRFSEDSSAITRRLGWLLIPLAAFLVWRLRGIRRRRRAAPAGGSKPSGPPARPGEDSEFYLIERRLAGVGFRRTRGEPLSRWVQRLSLAQPDSAALGPILALHYRYRFDPHGLTAAEREGLKREAESWLERHGRSSLTASR